MTSSYHLGFVVLSVLVAMLASFAALDLAGRVRSDTGATRLAWIAGGATVMGIGIWSMHFVGMLAFHLPVQIRYDIPLMLLSVVVAIAASLLALIIVTRPRVHIWTIIPGGIVMGVAIAGMHYIGMASIRTDARLSYSPSVVSLSVLIAIVASLVALWLTFRFRSDLTTRGVLLKSLSAVVMGVAISGMHYTAMAAAHFAPGDRVAPSTYHINASGELGAAVVVSTILMIVLAVIGAIIDRSMQAQAVFTRELAERAALLSKSEQRYRSVVDTALDAVVAMDSEGLIHDWNRQAETLFGWTRAEAMGQRMSDTIIPHRYRAAHEHGLKRFLETGQGPVLNTRIEITALRRDGVEVPVELAITPAKTQSGWTFNAFLRDLTERNKAAEAVRAGERRYRELFEDMPVGLYRSTLDGQLIDVNPAMVSMLGYPDRESLLATAATALYVNPADRSRWSGEIARAGVVRNFDVRMRRGDGTLIWARDTTHAKHDADGAIVFCEGVLEDVTEHVEAQQRLHASETQLRQALKMEAVGQLAGGVAHDFNNLLTVILSYCTMLLNRIAPSDPNRGDIEEITVAAERATRLTRQLLAFSRKQVMQPRILDINAVVGDLENLLRRLIGEDIALQSCLDPEVGRINADPGQLEQVLMNLVVNARDAMPNGGRLVISTANCDHSEADASALHAMRGSSVLLTVSDTGTGISPEVQQRIFDPFFTTKEQGRGTGLGLSTVYGIVKQSGGEIRVESELGRGTLFKVYFPRVENAPEALERDVLVREVPRGSETLLLVEDDASLRTLAMRVLKKLGYEVLVADGGFEALSIASDPRTAIDAVVTDVIMPGMNGRDLVERLIASRPELKVLFMSGYTNDDVLRRGVLQGEAAFLQKPFTPDLLARKVREVLDRASASAQL
jgi:two-component system, cell cycle sensor histidine kinase and response regulator CckA